MHMKAATMNTATSSAIPGPLSDSCTTTMAEPAAKAPAHFRSAARRLTQVTLVILTLGLCGAQHLCAWGWASVVGEGEILVEERQLPKFDEVSVMGWGQITLAQGDTDEYLVKIKAHENLLPHIDTTVSGGELEISYNKNLRSRQSIKILIVAPRYTYVVLAASGEMRSRDVIKGDKFDLVIAGSADARMSFDVDTLSTSIAGSGDLELKGRARVHDISIGGSGDIDALRLQTNRTDISIAGSGDATVWVEEFLDVSVFGSGDVRYKGDPKKDESILGSGSVVPISRKKQD